MCKVIQGIPYVSSNDAAWVYKVSHSQVWRSSSTFLNAAPIFKILKTRNGCWVCTRQCKKPNNKVPNQDVAKNCGSTTLRRIREALPAEGLLWQTLCARCCAQPLPNVFLTRATKQSRDIRWIKPVPYLLFSLSPPDRGSAFSNIQTNIHQVQSWFIQINLELRQMLKQISCARSKTATEDGTRFS